MDGLARLRKKGELTNVNESAGTCDCSIHGFRVRLRVRKRIGGAMYYSCRLCDRGGERGNRGSSTWRPSKASRLWHKYGITEAEFTIRREAQGGRCLICLTPEPKLVVDHDHETGKVRGLLCHRCNVGLGWFRDDVTRLKRAAKYLVTDRKNPSAASVRT